MVIIIIIKYEFFNIYNNYKLLELLFNSIINDRFIVSSETVWIKINQNLAHIRNNIFNSRNIFIWKYNHIYRKII